jgi:hypothetical protein
MKKCIWLTCLLLFISNCIIAQSRYDSLFGSWQIEKYESPYVDSIIKNGGTKCEGYLILKINKKGRVKFLFTDKKDSIIFKGKITFKQNNTIKISNNIHEKIFLGELENCITPVLRIEFRTMFYKTFKYVIEHDKLTFYYNLPKNPEVIKTITFIRLGDK